MAVLNPPPKGGASRYTIMCFVAVSMVFIVIFITYALYHAVFAKVNSDGPEDKNDEIITLKDVVTLE